MAGYLRSLSSSRFEIHPSEQFDTAARCRWTKIALLIAEETRVPSKSEEYRAKAFECEEWAKKVGSQSARERYIETAHEWHKLAEQHDRWGL
jgi:hypothetical protein